MLDNLTICNLHIYYFDNVSLLKAWVAASTCIIGNAIHYFTLKPADGAGVLLVKNNCIVGRLI